MLGSALSCQCVLTPCQGVTVTANDRFFQTKQAAAVLKHGILARYPTVFTTMTSVGRVDGRVVYLDGYAGPGRYEPEGDAAEGEPGSPLIAIRTAETVKTWKRTLHCVFVERNRTYADNLRTVLAEDAGPGLSYEVLDGDVQGHVDHVLSVAGSSPLFAFLDPFGTALPYAELRHTLLGRDTRLITEVLLNFNVHMVGRIGGYLTGDEEDEETTGGRSATLARMDAFLGGPWWQDEFRNARLSNDEGSAARAAMHIVEQFRRKVHDDTGFQSFAVPIRRRPHHNPLFVMLLFYRHAAAPYMFNESVSKANEEWRHHQHNIETAELLESLNDEQPNLFDVDDEGYTARYLEERVDKAERKLEEEWITLIAENIRHHVKSGPLPVEARLTDIHGTTLGLARPMHLTRAWDRLAEEGVVERRLPDKKLRMRRQTIYPVSR
ncbi:MAG: three-Cys-motif partner protein TcmP [Pseudonocardiaceae bacterium]|nr:three-Cys-motif partner protein TcmP [Pseudonocardiaceae bacterium]